jgi:hypothetical protein
MVVSDYRTISFYLASLENGWICRAFHHALAQPLVLRYWHSALKLSAIDYFEKYWAIQGVVTPI